MKIIASDYDGTLRHGSGIAERDREGIKLWRDNGNLFGVVTGRGAGMEKTIADDNLDVDFIIVYNGTDICDSEGNILKRLMGETDRLYELLPLILRKESDWAEFVTPGQSYYVTYGDTPEESKANWTKSEILKNVRQFMQIYALYETEAEALEAAERLNADFNDSVSALVNGRWLNVAPAGVTKATGVLEYAKLMSVEEKNIFTIGDSYNDLDMIKAFNGFTVHNGAEEVKKAARGVYSGVGELIQNLL